LYNVYCSTVNFYRRLWNGFELSSTINILFDTSSTSSTLALLSWVGYESIADAVQCIVSRTIVTPHLLAALVIRNSHYELFWHEHFAQCQRAEQQPNLDCAVSLSTPSIVDRLRDTAVARIIFDAVSF